MKELIGISIMLCGLGLATCIGLLFYVNLWATEQIETNAHTNAVTVTNVVTVTNYVDVIK